MYVGVMDDCVGIVELLLKICVCWNMVDDGGVDCIVYYQFVCEYCMGMCFVINFECVECMEGIWFQLYVCFDFVYFLGLFQNFYCEILMYKCQCCSQIVDFFVNDDDRQ